MKQLLLVAIIAMASSFNSFAQIVKGARLVEGTIGFSTSKEEGNLWSGSTDDSESRSTYFSFQPKIGFFTSETFVVGVGVNYESNSYESQVPFSTEYTSKSNIFLLNPYIRKYSKLKENLFFTTTLNLLVGVGKNKVGYGSDIDEVDVFALRTNITPGLTYFISNQWAITGNIGQLFFNYKKDKLDGETDSPKRENVSKSFGASFQFNTFGIGVQYYLRNAAE